tara:strand:+ start:48714 stop:48851 length:138 start_codon:yes stop_codon:yes gene_type:complete
LEYFAAAYLIAGFVFFGYSFILSRKIKDLKNDIQELQIRIEENSS